MPDPVSVCYDAQDNPWLLKWDIPGGEGKWTALGYDERNYPKAMALSEDEASRTFGIRRRAGYGE